MSAISYEVGITFHQPRLLPAWVEWLEREHIADVMSGGATSAQVVRLDSESGSDEAPRCVVRYEFPNREAFDRYLRDHAPRLRVEGLARFAPPDVTYERRCGDVLLRR